MLEGKYIICKGTSQSPDVLVLQPVFVSFVPKPLQKREAPASGPGLLVVPIVWWEHMGPSDSSAHGRSLGPRLTYCEHQGVLTDCAKDLVKDSFLSLWILSIFALGICPNHILSVSISVTWNGPKYFWWRGRGLSYFSYWFYDDGLVIYLLRSSFYRKIGFKLKLK